MPTTAQLRDRLINKLQELFQLDQPDLDFGFYKIMHAKAEQVTAFIERDLLKIIEAAFGQVDQQKLAALQTEYQQAVQFAKSFGALNPEETDGVQAIKTKIVALQESGTIEADIYDQLYRFFSRYYDNGDFISQRYYARETAGKAAPYAIPYGGEEVKLHWANADQFYIKTAEYFNRYTVNLREAEEVKKNQGSLPLALDEKPLKVTFAIGSGSEGEHGNVKAGDNTKRFFLIDENNPVELTESGELFINFVYRADPEKSGTEGTWRSLRNQESCDRVLAELEGLSQEFLAVLKIPAPTEKDKNRPLLAKYINQYTARNTMDYFIHKDLGSFLRRELDFYIKNEVMRLDDIENADVPTVESYLGKIKVLRQISHQLIDFLAQLEDFQKKLWLKKKFVTETNYCITLDRISEDFYAQIAANESQRLEWVSLFAIAEIKASDGDLLSAGAVGYSEPLTVEFLQQNRFLVLDTRFFSEDFKARLLATFEDLDDQCDGLLIHSENFQALNLLQERYREQVKCVYIDPPYNTGKDEFLYKDNYQHSSWLSFINDRVYLCSKLMTSSGAFFCSIDDNEAKNVEFICNNVFEEGQLISPLYIQVRYGNKTLSEDSDFQRTIERVFIYAKNSYIFSPIKDITEYPIDKFCWKIKEITEGNLFDAGGKKCWMFRPGEYKIEKVEPNFNGLKETWATGTLLRQKGSSGEFFGINLAPRKEVDGLGCLYKVEGIGEDGLGFRYFTGPQRESASKGKFYSGIPLQTLDKLQSGDSTKEIPIHNFMDFAGDFGNCRLEGKVDIRGGKKPEKLLERLISLVSKNKIKDVVLDCFGGSGTTPSVAHKLNKKYIAIEQGDYFDSKMLIRMKHTLNGTAGGINNCPSGIYKYIRLESYEDTLNNLRLDHNSQRDKTLQKNNEFRQDYMLHYWLEIETRGSQSLLNIDNFAQPNAYKLNLKIPGSDQYQQQTIDLIETFNYLIGLRVKQIDAPQHFNAQFKREIDPELPESQQTKLILDGKLQSDPNGQYWFRKIEGTVPKNPYDPNNGITENVLIVWRNLTDDLEKDNTLLEQWFLKNRINPKDFEYDTIYVNGSNTLPNLKKDDEHWKVRLIEETFHQKMWDIRGF